MIGSGSLRLLVSKCLKTNSISKAALKYENFIQILKEIIATSGSPRSKNATSQFFSQISVPCKEHFNVNLALTERKKNLELDLNIKEALNTLKQSGKRSSDISPASTPLRGQKIGADISKKILAEHFELKEFIKIEKQVATDGLKVTVNLANMNKPRYSSSTNSLRYSMTRENHSKPSPKVNHTNNEPRRSVNNYTNNEATKRRENYATPSSRKSDVSHNTKKAYNFSAVNDSLKKNVVVTKKVSNISVAKCLDRHRNYILKVKKSQFSNLFMLKLIWIAWRSVMPKKKYSKRKKKCLN